ncbi:MAG: cupin domain-containing protein [Burkholderiales bacterium]
MLSGTMNVISMSEVRACWHDRGFSCDLWVDPPGQVWADFVHEVDELVMPIEGSIELEFGGKVFRPRLGEELAIPANAVHTVRSVGGTIARWLYGYRCT